MNVRKSYTSKGVWDVVFDLNVDKHGWKNQRLILLVPQANITITWKIRKKEIFTKLMNDAMITFGWVDNGQLTSHDIKNHSLIKLHFNLV